jgi:NAD(P)-dependent dehydrogenase (short-subunit alcohol dehydrogenase family)
MEFWDPGQWLAVGIVLVVVIICLWMYLRGTVGRCDSDADLSGKTAIVTGANTGIGFHTALDFAKRNARVIIACRDEKKAEQAKSKIVAESGNTNVTVSIVDLSYMKSVRAFAKKIIESEQRLDILVNNAGIVSAGKPREVTDEGLETLYAANYFGPFLLTNLLLDLMKKSAPSRIVNLSSVVNKFGKIDFTNLQGEKSFNYRSRYFDSKLAVILFTRERARQLEGTGVTANVVHPGSVSTELLRNMFFLIRYPVQLAVRIFFKVGLDFKLNKIAVFCCSDHFM